MRRETAAAASAPRIGPAVMIEDPFDPSNQQATLIQHQQQQLSDSLDHADQDSDWGSDYDDPNKSHPIRMASKTILSHLVNHLFHFPMCAGKIGVITLQQDCILPSPYIHNNVTPTVKI